MQKDYYKDKLNVQISMGEVALIYYKTILDKEIMNRIIISTILILHTKNHIEFGKNGKGKIILKIVKSNKKLKKSEDFILQCLKKIDVEEDNELELNEITQKNNKIFYKNKEKIKDYIVQEAIEDGYIDKEKLEEKEKNFTNFKNCLLDIISYQKSQQIDMYTEKAKQEKETLQELEKYLDESSLIKERDILEIYLWEKYLAYAVIFNINGNIIKILEVNLEKQIKPPIEIQFDFFENKYFYINEEGQKIYIDEKKQKIYTDTENQKMYIYIGNKKAYIK